MTETHMTIRQMCEAFDVTPRTLRFYEAKELLSPVRQGTRRLFTRSDRARLKLILRGKRYNFSLEDIRQLLDLYDPETENYHQQSRACELAQIKLDELTAQRDELAEIITELRAEIETCSRIGENARATQAA